MTQTSPITGIIDENLVILDFGKHEGKSISQIAKDDPDFYEQLIQDRQDFAIRRHRDKTFRLYINPLHETDQ